jgi:hypothetical protein
VPSRNRCRSPANPVRPDSAQAHAGAGHAPAQVAQPAYSGAARGSDPGAGAPSLSSNREAAEPVAGILQDKTLGAVHGHGIGHVHRGCRIADAASSAAEASGKVIAASWVRAPRSRSQRSATGLAPDRLGITTRSAASVQAEQHIHRDGLAISGSLVDATRSASWLRTSGLNVAKKKVAAKPCASAARPGRAKGTYSLTPEAGRRAPGRDLARSRTQVAGSPRRDALGDHRRFSSTRP